MEIFLIIVNFVFIVAFIIVSLYTFNEKNKFKQRAEILYLEIDEKQQKLEILNKKIQIINEFDEKLNLMNRNINSDVLNLNYDLFKALSNINYK